MALSDPNYLEVYGYLQTRKPLGPDPRVEAPKVQPALEDHAWLQGRVPQTTSPDLGNPLFDPWVKIPPAPATNLHVVEAKERFQLVRPLMPAGIYGQLDMTPKISDAETSRLTAHYPANFNVNI